MEQVQPAQLSTRHQQILRYVFEGMSNLQIAALLGMKPATIGVIKKSPIFRGELARLQEQAEKSMTNMPVRLALVQELNGFGIEALRLNRQLMNDQTLGVKLRSKIATHAMDRIVFGKHADEDGETKNYRDVLSKLNEVSAQLKRSLVTPVETMEMETTPTGLRVVSDEEVA